MRDMWVSILTRFQDEKGKLEDEALSWLAWVSIDVIGWADFGYDFGAVAGRPQGNELMKAVIILTCVAKRAYWDIVEVLFPIFSKFVSIASTSR